MHAIKGTALLGLMSLAALAGCRAQSESSAPASAAPAANAAPAQPPTATTTTPATVAAAAPAATVTDARPAPLRGLAEQDCKQAKPGSMWECTVGDYKVTADYRPCSTDGLYGNINSSEQAAVTVYDAFPSDKGQPVAKFQHRQFVCELARAGRNGEDEWFYVVAIPAASIKACQGSDRCVDPGNLKVERIRPAAAGPSCQADASGHFAGDCAGGWVASKDYQDYPMGLDN